MDFIDPLTRNLKFPDFLHTYAILEIHEESIINYLEKYNAWRTEKNDKKELELRWNRGTKECRLELWIELSSHAISLSFYFWHLWRSYKHMFHFGWNFCRNPIRNLCSFKLKRIILMTLKESSTANWWDRL